MTELNKAIAAASPEQSDRQSTAPKSISMSMRSFESTESATELANVIATHVQVISRAIDLSNLDGITVAYDYRQALAELDRGYETSYKLTPSTDFVEGVAMTPAVMRNNEIRSHIVFNAVYVQALADETSDFYLHAVHIVAHECAHVEITRAFDLAFPGTLLQQSYINPYDARRWDVILACWDEYAATRIAAGIGRDPTTDYETSFIETLQKARDLANEKIKRYRLHANLAQILDEVHSIYGALMKLACYHLGNMAGKGITVADLPNTQTALEDNWFAPHWALLEERCAAVWEMFGRWDDKSRFEQIGEVCGDVLASGGVLITKTGIDSARIDIPFSPETVPAGELQ